MLQVEFQESSTQDLNCMTIWEVSTIRMPFLINPPSNKSDIFIYQLAEVPGATGVNMQPAEHIKNVSFSF